MYINCLKPAFYYARIMPISSVLTNKPKLLTSCHMFSSLEKKHGGRDMAARKMKFKTETQTLLNLVINSLYSHKEIFLRELVSNASDSLDKLRFLSLTDKKSDASNLRIKIVPDKDNKTLTVSDTGIGMNEQDLIDNLGTIAKSGSGAFLEALEKNQDNIPELIGQFGVGFYASFMVADSVTVISRKTGEKETWKWESEGSGSFSLDKEETQTRETSGTDIILHLKEDCHEYLEEYRIRTIIKKYSDFIEYPVLMDVEKYQEKKEGEDEPPKKIEEEALNSQKAIWMRPASEIKEEEYEEFYKHVSHDYNKPFTHIHYKAEGTTEFNALLFLPSQMPFDMMFSDDKPKGVHLYVKRVFITDEAEALMPRYLRFVKGVVDSSDLPLNVSREILQQEKALHTIKSNLQKKVLDTLGEKLDKDRKTYEDFFRELGSILKEGIALDFSNREKLLDLMLFQSTTTKPGEYCTLAEYLGRMPEDQEHIYFISGESRQEVENSPYLESLKKKQYEVLLLVDTIDEFIAQHLNEYKEKKFKSAAHGDISLEKDKDKKDKK